MIAVEIVNFQALDRLHLTIEGFTALVGRSNIGKSSIVRALKCALTGSSNSDFVRHDAATCARVLRQTKKCDCATSVKLTFDGGPSLLWEKGDRINRYTVWKDGKESVYDRVGKDSDLPDFVGEQFSPVKMGSKDNLLQVSDQFDPLFLLDLSGTVVADTLSDLGQLDAVNKALALASKDRREASSTRKLRETDLAEINEQLGRYARLDVATERARALQETYRTIQLAANRVQLAGHLLNETMLVAKEILRVAEALRSAVPDPVGLLDVSQRRSKVIAFATGWDDRARALRGLVRAVEPALPEGASLQAKAQSLKDVKRLETEHGTRAALVEKLDGVGLLTLPDVMDLKARSSAIETASGWLLRLRTIKVFFDRARPVQALRDATFESERATAHLTRIRQLDGFLARLERLQTLEASVENEFAAAAHDESSVLAEFQVLGLCPSCNQPARPMERHTHESRISV